MNYAQLKALQILIYNQISRSCSLISNTEHSTAHFHHSAVRIVWSSKFRAEENFPMMKNLISAPCNIFYENKFYTDFSLRSLNALVSNKKSPNSYLFHIWSFLAFRALRLGKDFLCLNPKQT